jgi:hypothetical protein
LLALLGAHRILYVSRVRVKILACCDSVKINPITGPRCPEAFRKLRFPDYVTTARDDDKVVSLTHRPLFTPRKYSWNSFLLEAESTPGQYVTVYTIKSFQIMRVGFNWLNINM